MTTVKASFDHPALSLTSKIVKVVVDHPGLTSKEISYLVGQPIKMGLIWEAYAKTGLIRVERNSRSRRGWIVTYTASEELVRLINAGHVVRTNTYWTQARLEEFAARYKNESRKSLAVAFGITISAVNGVARRLNLRKSGRPPHIRKKSSAPQKFWSDSEAIELAKRYPNEDNERLARAFGVTKAALEHKASRLELRKAYGFASYPAELREVIQLNNQLKRVLHERHKKTT